MIVLPIFIGITGAAVALLLIITLFTKKEYTVQRDVIINQPRPLVFNYIKQVKNQDHYAIWNQFDPAMKKTYTGTDGTVGFMYAWDSSNKKAGKGEQQITAVREGERLDTAIHFIKPFEGRSNAYMSTETAGDAQTKVTWSFNGKMKYPLNAMLLFMNMEKMIGTDLAEGLDNLKIILEKR